MYVASPDDDPVPDHWPFSLAPVRQIVGQGLAFARPITVLVGENGSGKSTIVEAIAEAYGVDVRGGHAGRMYASSMARSPLGERLRLVATRQGARMKGRRAKGFFLRAETALGVFEYMSDMGVAGYGEGDRHLGRVSHGEGFLQVFQGRFTEPGLYILDEPEAALSFQSCLSLVHLLTDLAKEGSQVICATHSPLVAAVPRAQILELDESGLRPVIWKELALVDHWRRYLADPGRYLRHLM